MFSMCQINNPNTSFFFFSSLTNKFTEYLFNCLSLLPLCSWGAPSTRHSALKKAPKHTQTLRKSPRLTPQLPTPQRCFMRAWKEEKTSPHPSKPQPLPPPLCEYTNTLLTKWDSELSFHGCLALIIASYPLQDHGDYRRGRQWGNGGIRPTLRTLGERERTDRHPLGGLKLRTSAGAAQRSHEQHAGLFFLCVHVQLYLSIHLFCVNITWI